jgi:hypothetical protein
MFPNTTETAMVAVRDGKLVVKVQAERPVMVFRDAAAQRAAGAQK